jgi:flavin reductase (DIM6/NTAB) family NADH-FMN oxidoreductase RutF
MKTRDPLTLPESLLAQLKEGAFLTVKAGDALNTMTIGWGLIGILWQKPVFMVPVRTSRHTHSLIEKAKDFTVTAPSGDMQAALNFCGTRSGRDLDKIKACDLKTQPGQDTVSPILDMPGLHLECRILYKTPMDPAHMDASLQSMYPAKDYHILYFGEILSCYEQ